MQDLGVFHSLGALWLRVLNELETKGAEAIYTDNAGESAEVKELLYLTAEVQDAALPDAMVQYLNGDIAPAALRADGIRGIDYTFSTISVRPDWIREAHDNGMVVNTWTVNAEQDMMSCIALGMDFITTNYPQTLKELLTKTFVAPN